jgi:antitoxin ParD1/3/4
MSEKLSITLPPEMVAVIKQQVDAGRYASVSEVLRQAMRSWMREEEEHAERLAAVRARLTRSLDDPRPAVALDDAMERLEAHVRQSYRAR